MLHGVGKGSTDNGFQSKYAKRYTRRIIQLVNGEEEEAEVQKRKNEDRNNKSFGPTPQEGKAK